MDRQDTLSALSEAKRGRERIFTELQNLQARAQAEGATAGLDERIGNLNAGIARQDERIAELEADYGREALGRTRSDGGVGMTMEEFQARRGGGPVYTESTGPAESRGSGNAHRDQAMRTVERWEDHIDRGAGD